MRDKYEKELQQLEKELNNTRVLKTTGLVYEDFLQEIFDTAGQNSDLPECPAGMVDRIDNVVADRLHTIRRRERGKHKRARRLKIAACFFAFLFASSSIAVSVKASRAGIANYLIASFDQFSEIRYDTDQNARPPLGWFNRYFPTWLPADYTVAHISLEAQADIIWYKDRAGHELSFCVMGTTELNIDTENMTSTPLLIHAYQAQLYAAADGRTYTLVIPMEDSIIVISGEITFENIVAVANSIKFD